MPSGAKPWPDPLPTEPKRFETFRDFYPFYLGEHRNAACRRLHVIGSALVLVALAAAIATRNPWLLLLMPLIGYGFAWVGHSLSRRTGRRPSPIRCGA